MDVLVFLVPLALGLGLLGLTAFLWSLNSGQYDDLDGAAWRAIADDDASLKGETAQLAGAGATDFTKPTEPGRNW
jgi:cbb3-type cytochrome oxidase maturation protein